MLIRPAPVPAGDNEASCGTFLCAQVPNKTDARDEAKKWMKHLLVDVALANSLPLELSSIKHTSEMCRSLADFSDKLSKVYKDLKALVDDGVTERGQYVTIIDLAKPTVAEFKEEVKSARALPGA